MLYKMKTSHSMIIQLLESQIEQVLSGIYPNQQKGLPCENEENPKNET